MLRSIVGIVTISHPFKSWKLRLNRLDEVSVRYKLLDLPLVAVEWHVLLWYNAMGRTHGSV